MTWLRSRLLVFTGIVLLAVIIIPLVALSIIGLHGYKTRGQANIDTAATLLDERASRLLETQATSTAYALAEFLWRRNEDIRALARLPRTETAYFDFADVLQSPIETINAAGEPVHITLPLYREVAFIGVDGREEIKIESICNDYPWDCELAPVPSHVAVRGPGENNTLGVEDYFQAAQELRAGEIYVGHPFGNYVSSNESFKSAQSPAGRRFEGIIRFIMPVYETAGSPPHQELQGYVMLALDYIHVLAFIDHLDPTVTHPVPAVDPSSGNFAYIIGANGVTIAHPLHHQIAGINEQGNMVAGFQSPVFAQLLENSLAAPQGVIEYYETDDNAQSLAYSIIPYDTGSNYNNGHGFGIVVVVMDAAILHTETRTLTTQFNKSLDDLTVRFGMLILLTSLAVGGITLGFGHFVVRPIRSVTRHAQVMEKRHLTESEIAFLKTYPGGGEVAQMAHHFGTMAETMQTREQEIAQLLKQTDEALRRRLQELSTLEEVGRRLTSTLDLTNDPTASLKFATQALCDMTQAQAVASHIEAEEGKIEEGKKETAFYHVVGDTALVHDETADPIELPLELEGHSIGHFLIFTPNNRLEGVDRVFADQLASWVSIAVKNARQFKRIQNQQRELEITNQKVVAANRLKSEFLSTLSHELRTPLHAITGFCGIMLEGMGGQIDEEARHMLTRIDANSKRLLDLINDMLDIAKIESGRLDLAIAPFSPHDLVGQWKTQMIVLAQQKNLNFEVNIAPTLPKTLWGDERRISQIAVNLLSNAFKFTEKGKVTLALEWQSPQWIIKVTDTGIGIPDHAKELIFDEFRQVDGTPRRVYGGTGLGLAIVRNLCKLMDGTIEVESEVNKGSTFTVTLPLAGPHSPSATP